MLVPEIARSGMAVAARHAVTETATASRMAVPAHESKRNNDRGFISENFPGAMIQLIFHTLDSLLRNIAQILTFWEILTQQSICILVRSSLAR